MDFYHLNLFLVSLNNHFFNHVLLSNGFLIQFIISHIGCFMCYIDLKVMPFYLKFLILYLIIKKFCTMFTVDWNDDADLKEEILSIIADLLGFSWTGEL